MRNTCRMSSNTGTWDMGDTQKLTERVARLAYEHGLTHQEIADILNLKRIKITRLLAKARERDLVIIRVKSDVELFPIEAEALKRTFGLENTWIAPTADSREATKTSVAKVAAHALNTMIAPNMTIAMSLSNVLAEALKHIEPANREITVIPSTGSMLNPRYGASIMDLTATLADIYAGTALKLPAPLVSRGSKLATDYLNDRRVSEALRLASKSDLFIGGLGSINSKTGLLTGQQLTSKEIDELRRAGAIGDVGARFYDIDGSEIETPVSSRIVGLTLSEVSSIPKRLVVSFGPERVKAIRTGIRSGLVNSLVTDLTTARELLEQ